jgi:precorrin-8X/cobalt-precorrin-8 methylmutase
MEMVRTGINKKLLNPFGCEVLCFINDPETISMAERNQKTRAESAVDRAASSMEGGMYVVGNAPTALLRLLDLVDKHQVRPALIIGFPVGFVNAKESKERLLEAKCPYITNDGRKGGSTTAVSAVNALAHLASGS